MDNFSIVKFLQSLLSPTPSNAEKTAENTNGTQAMQDEKNPPLQADIKQEKQELQGQRAVVQFMEEHERRAKRIKK